MIIAILKDLFFISKIKETAVQLNKTINFIKNYYELNNFLDNNEKINYENIGLIIIDLNFNEIIPLETIKKLKINKKLKNKRIITYCFHVQTELMDKARELGIEVMPQSLFTTKLKTLINN